jgi:hypothetical protein
MVSVASGHNLLAAVACWMRQRLPGLAMRICISCNLQCSHLQRNTCMLVKLQFTLVLPLFCPCGSGWQVVIRSWCTAGSHQSI